MVVGERAATEHPADAPGRRTQRERSDATSGDLLAAARDLFAADGYAATSLDAVCARAGVSKGALYHHYRDKRDLFRAVYAADQKALARTINAEYTRHDDPWDAFVEACVVFLRAATRPGAARVSIIDPPAALGWEAMREVQTTCYEMLRRGLTRAMDAGRITRRPLEPVAALLDGALCEGSIAVVMAADPDAMLTDVEAELRRLLTLLAG